jgi:AmiR/NasT family two-component response regulator
MSAADADNADALEIALRRLLSVTEASFEESAGLRRALDTRIAIEQAKGILAERLRISLDEAFELLRAGARDGRVRVHVLAREVVESRDTPKAILQQLERRLAPERP